MLSKPECQKYVGSNEIFNKKSVIISGLGVCWYGGYLGILFQSRFFRTLDWPDMLKTGVIPFILRYLIIIVLMAPFAAIFLVIPKNTNLAVMIIFSTFVPLILATFSAFAFANYFFVRFKLVNETNAGLLPID